MTAGCTGVKSGAYEIDDDDGLVSINEIESIALA